MSDALADFMRAGTLDLSSVCRPGAFCSEMAFCPVCGSLYEVAFPSIVCEDCGESGFML